MRILGELLLAAAAVIAASGPSFAASRSFDVAPFARVEIGPGLVAEVTGGTEQAVTAESDDAALLRGLRIVVRNGVLSASLDGTPEDRPLSLTIGSPTITAISAKGPSTVTAIGISGEDLAFSSADGASLSATGITGRDYAIAATGGSRLELGGTCVRARIGVDEKAMLDTVALLCADIEVTADDGGRALVFASHSAEAEAADGASIVVRGDPLTFVRAESRGGTVDRAP